MARSRNIKPGFFTHDKMSENDPLGRLLFLGLTTIADYKGELEWRPKRIKIEILPYDDCDLERLAINLERSGFIRFYSGGGKIYVHIVNFTKHQNPHKNEREAGTAIPAFTESMAQLIDLETLTIIRDDSGSNRDKDGTAPADSLNLIPDSNIPPPPPRAKKSAVVLKTYLAQCKEKSIEPVPESDAVFDYADDVGIPHDFLHLCWREFVDRYSDKTKRYADWRAVFRQAVRGNWLKIWYIVDNEYRLTTVGIQAQRKQASRGAA
jgi:hypothetical protein